MMSIFHDNTFWTVPYWPFPSSSFSSSSSILILKLLPLLKSTPSAWMMALPAKFNFPDGSLQRGRAFGQNGGSLYVLCMTNKKKKIWKLTHIEKSWQKVYQLALFLIPVEQDWVQVSCHLYPLAWVKHPQHLESIEVHWGAKCEVEGRNEVVGNGVVLGGW